MTERRRTDSRRWEYRTIEPPKGLTKRETVDPTEELNRLGADGWELAETISYDKGGTKLLVLKRPLPADEASTDE